MKSKISSIINRLHKLKDLRNKANVSIFLFCLVISVSIWVLIKMSKNYSSDIDYKLNFINPPANQIISEVLDSVVYLQIDSRGFDLLNRQYFKKSRPLNIDLQGVEVHKPTSSSESYILSESILNQIRNQNDFPNYINRIYPDTLHLKLETIVSKEVEIRLKLEIIPKKQHYIYGKITQSLQKINITGPPSIVDTITFINTEFLKLENVQSNQNLNLKLMNPYIDEKVSFSVDNLDIFIPIEEYTENSITIPIGIKDSHNLRIKLFPETITITYLVALKDFERTSPDMFSATITYDEKSTSYQKVFLERHPNFVKIVSIQPESVEYLILANND